MFLSLNVHAQFQSELTDVSYSIYTGININLIRNCTSTYSVGNFYTYFGDNYLFITDHSNYSIGSAVPFPARAVHLSSYFLQIEDLRVFDNYIFFCGRNKNGVGFIGYMPISDFNNPTATVRYKEVTGTTMFYQLAAFKDSFNLTKVVAVGHDYINYSDHFIVEITDILGTPTTNQKQVLAEQLYEIFYTNGHLVTVGFSGTFNALCLRLANPDNVMDATFDMGYLFSALDDPILANTESDVDKDYLTVTYPSFDSNLSDYVTRIRVFDLNTMKMINAQQFQPYDKVAPLGITYLSNHREAVVLEQFTFPFSTGSLQGNFVKLDLASTTSYSATLRYYPTFKFMALDDFDGNHFLSVGIGHMYLQDNSAPPTPDCPVTDVIKVMPIPIYSGFTNISSRILPQDMNPFHLENPPTVFVNNTHNCHQ